MLITIEDKVFTDRSFYVDGYRFINCSFERCNLYILRGTVEFHHCVSKGGTRFWGEDAMRCIQLYTLDYPNLALSDVFSAKRYPDKSFTIAKDVSI